jgi:WD40 repeat protein
LSNPNHWIVAIDVQTGREQYRLLASVGKGSEIMQLVPCPSGPFLAVAYGSGSAIYGNPLDLFDLEKKQQLTRDLIKPILELPSQVLGPIAFSPDGKWLAVTIRPATALFETEPVGPHQVFVFETTTWSKVVALETQSSQTQNFSAILFSPDSRRLMTTSLDGFMRVWDRETGQLMWTSPQAIHPILSAVLSPDGSKLCVFRGPSEVGQNRGGQFEVWNLIEQH